MSNENPDKKMSCLKALEKAQFEKLFKMGGGYVLEFSNRTFADFFAETVAVDIYAPKYEVLGTSKANRLRAFWDIESSALVGKVLAELIEYWVYENPEADPKDQSLAEQCRGVAARLLGAPINVGASESSFLNRDLENVLIGKVPIDQSLIPILEYRFLEAQRCLDAESPLAAIFMCGSILEGLLLGTAIQFPQQFNQSVNSPKDKSGKVKQFHEWSLAQMIEIACDEGYLGLDVKKFGHALRDFRNYINPYQQFSS